MHKKIPIEPGRADNEDSPIRQSEGINEISTPGTSFYRTLSKLSGFNRWGVSVVTLRHAQLTTLRSKVNFTIIIVISYSPVAQPLPLPSKELSFISFLDQVT